MNPPKTSNQQYLLYYHKSKMIDLKEIPYPYPHLDTKHPLTKITLADSIQKPQMYLPIYQRFFELNDHNYQSISLNHQHHIKNLQEITTISSSSDVSAPTSLPTSLPNPPSEHRRCSRVETPFGGSLTDLRSYRFASSVSEPHSGLHVLLQKDPNVDVRRTVALGDDAVNVVKASTSRSSFFLFFIFISTNLQPFI